MTNGPDLYNEIYSVLSYAFHNEHMHGQDVLKSKNTQMMKWMGRNRTTIIALVERITVNHEQHVELPQLTEDQLRKVRTRLVEDLDLAPPSKNSKLEFRPAFPMTLSEVIKISKTRDNPAPVWKTGQYKSFSNYDVPRRYDIKTDEHNHIANALGGEAWRLSAPEGIPPIPRRGGIYSANEASALSSWCQTLWPAMREWDKQIRLWERALRMAGATDDPFTPYRESWIGSISPLDKCSSHNLLQASYYDDSHQKHIYLSAVDKTPRQWVADVEKWCREVFFPIFTIVAPILSDPAMYLPESRLPKNIDATYKKICAVGKHVEFDKRGWLAKIGINNWDRLYRPGKRVENLMRIVEGGDVTPSEGLRLQKDLDEREENERRNKEESRLVHQRKVAQALRPIKDRGLVWNAANVERHLPRGYQLVVSQKGQDPDVRIQTPDTEITIFVSSAGSRTATFEKLGQSLIPLME